jgi:hypothetical protein
MVASMPRRGDAVMVGRLQEGDQALACRLAGEADVTEQPSLSPRI